MKLTQILLPAMCSAALVSGASAISIALTNGNFEDTAIVGANQTIDGWVEDEGSSNTGDANYVDAIPFTGNTTNHLYLKANTNNWIGQNIPTATADATTYSNYTITLDSGMRTAATERQTNHGFDVTVRVSLWNMTDGVELAGQDLVISNPGTQVANAFTNGSLMLGYDNTAQDAGDEIQLRFTHVGPTGAQVDEAPPAENFGWRATAVFDNVTVDAVPEPSSTLLAALAGLGLMARRRR